MLDYITFLTSFQYHIYNFALNSENIFDFCPAKRLKQLLHQRRIYYIMYIAKKLSIHLKNRFEKAFLQKIITCAKNA